MDRKESLGMAACALMLAINLGIVAVTVVMAMRDAPSQYEPVAAFGPDTPVRATQDAKFDNGTLVEIPPHGPDLMFSQGAAEETP